MKWTGNPILLLCVQVKSLSWAPELGTIFFILVAINIVCVLYAQGGEVNLHVARLRTPVMTTNE